MTISDKIGQMASDLYEKVLIEDIKKLPIPNHLGIITDGNRRYATEKGLPLNDGHIKGKDKLEEVLQWCMDIGIKVVTVYGFSTENLKRSNEEVDFLFRLIDRSLNELMKDERVKKNGIKVRVIGQKEHLPDYLKETIRNAERLTSKYNNFRLNLAIGYGGREEILDGIKRIAGDVVSKKIDINDINEELFRTYLYDSSVPDPDLILRTSGEERVSNFLLWQSAYSELYFTEVYWPDLKHVDFLRAIRNFQLRKRRYGV
ncbi:undecaprenyl pyrophosphate synthetase [mine drainage metagenome]|uniref:Undecaprenyl pyrophosphate synthetase n=1 Tax=mine drainage metagenome TaxID=410659 RepID=T0ZY38_9ZZZZ